MLNVRCFLIGTLAAVAITAFVPVVAAAKPSSCGRTSLAPGVHEGTTFSKLTASGTTCRVARKVAIAWQSHPRRNVDGYTCRVLRAATMTKAGLVRCTRRRAVISGNYVLGF